MLVGGPCTTSFNTYFAPEPADPQTEAPATQVVNVATNPVAIPVMVPAGDPALNGGSEGGLSCIDVVINAKTGGGQNQAIFHKSSTIAPREGGIP